MQTPLYQLRIEQSLHKFECLPGKIAVMLEFVGAWESLNEQQIAERGIRTLESNVFSSIIPGIV